MDKKILENIEKEITEVFKQMVIVRKEKGFQAYKALTDSINRLIDIHIKGVPRNRQEKEGTRVWLYYLNDETMDFYNNVFNILKNEEKEIDIIRKEALSNKSYKEYRDWVVAYDKIIRIYSHIKEEYDRSLKSLKALGTLRGLGLLKS